MKTLGVLGGMSWESTALYYRLVNQGVAARLGGLHSAKLLLHSVDFEAVAALQRAGDWRGAARLLAQAAAGLKAAGAEGLVIATNTMHKVAAVVEAEGGLPLLHIADATGEALRAAGVRRAALLGTRFTVDDPSIVRDRLERRHGLALVLPAEEDRALMHRVIFDELCRGVVSDASRAAVVALIARQRDAGAEAVILGCTEIALLIDAACSPLPVFDTTALHAAAAVRWMLDDTHEGATLPPPTEETPA
ncbi:MAG: aspartate/glutamate racemase family protein [Rubrivivax sp.]|nr:aspartate/glutamate racemase family protein [Rubrivivax sp.]